VLRRSLTLTGAGIVLGSLGAVAGSRLLRSFILTGPGQSLVLVGAALLMLAVAVASSLLPAWRAARIDPAVALREE
jgi:putative ABC transport system permease protein